MIKTTIRYLKCLDLYIIRRHVHKFTAAQKGREGEYMTAKQCSYPPQKHDYFVYIIKTICSKASLNNYVFSCLLFFIFIYVVARYVIPEDGPMD